MWRITKIHLRKYFFVFDFEFGELLPEKFVFGKNYIYQRVNVGGPFGTSTKYLHFCSNKNIFVARF
jgi:hypothetical protein